MSQSRDIRTNWKAVAKSDVAARYGNLVKVLADECRTAPPDETLIAADINKAPRMFQKHSAIRMKK